jgi:hypothetical protein
VRFDFFLQLLFETFRVLRIIQWDTVINVKMSSCKELVIFCCILTKLEFSQQIFEKVSNIKFHQNPSSASRNVACGRTDKQAYMTKLTHDFVILRTRLVIARVLRSTAVGICTLRELASDSLYYDNTAGKTTHDCNLNARITGSKCCDRTLSECALSTRSC